MYTIVLTNGKAMNINADEVTWFAPERMVKFMNNDRIVARINMENVVGWVETDYVNYDIYKKGSSNKNE